MSEVKNVSGGRPFYHGLFEEWEIGAVKKAVVSFKARYPWLRFPEYDDLVQECLNHWFFIRDRYDPDKGASLKTFMSKVVNLCLKQILRQQMYNNRRLDHMVRSLDESRGEFGETLADCIADRRQPDLDLVLDVKSVMAELTPFQQDICCLLSRDFSVKKAAEALGRPRTTVRDQIKRIAEAFRRRGLGGQG